MFFAFFFLLISGKLFCKKRKNQCFKEILELEMFSKLDQGFLSHQPSFFLLNSSVSASWWLLGNLDSGNSSLCFLCPGLYVSEQCHV